MRIVAAAVSLLVAGADAQEPFDPRSAQPERPTVATHAGTVAPRYLEIETGLQLDDQPSSPDGFGVPTVLKIGMHPRAQLDLFLPVMRMQDESGGVGDLAVGVKWRVVEHAPLLGRVALQPSVKAPTGSVASGTGTGTTDVGVLLITSRALGPVAMDLNAGYTRRSGDGTDAPRDATVWTASFGGSFTRRVGWVAELFGFPATSGPSGQESATSLLVGPMLLLRPWLVLDVGVIAPVAGPQTRSAYVGVTWNAGRL